MVLECLGTEAVKVLGWTFAVGGATSLCGLWVWRHWIHPDDIDHRLERVMRDLGVIHADMFDSGSRPLTEDAFRMMTTVRIATLRIRKLNKLNGAQHRALEAHGREVRRENIDRRKSEALSVVGQRDTNAIKESAARTKERGRAKTARPETANIRSVGNGRDHHDATAPGNGSTDGETVFLQPPNHGTSAQ